LAVDEIGPTGSSFSLIERFVLGAAAFLAAIGRYEIGPTGSNTITMQSTA
jgi:hypothetical protein